VPTEPNPRFVRRLRLSGLLVLTGLAVQLTTLIEARPYTFLTFMTVGVGLVIAGAMAYIWARLAL
jgi:hypothetical protein